MTVIHTSDWLLESMFGAEHLSFDQEAVLEWLHWHMAQRRVELVVISVIAYRRRILQPESAPLLTNVFYGVQDSRTKFINMRGKDYGVDRAARNRELQGGNGICIRVRDAATPEVTRLNFARSPFDVNPVHDLDPQLASSAPPGGRGCVPCAATSRTFPRSLRARRSDAHVRTPCEEPTQEAEGV